jgi:hypothetical protein
MQGAIADCGWVISDSLRLDHGSTQIHNPQSATRHYRTGHSWEPRLFPAPERFRAPVLNAALRSAEK